MAWRNVWRNKTRSLVMVIAVALGLWGGIFANAFMQGMAEQQIYSAIHTETGHVQLNRPGFMTNHDLQLQVGDAGQMTDTIQKDPGVAAASARIQVTAMVSTASGSAGVMVNGIQPSGQERVSNLSGMLGQGNFFKSDQANPVVIGQQLADKIKAGPHSRIVLTLQTTSGDIIYGAFKVTGIFRTHDSDFDREMIFVRDKDLRGLINFPPGAASLITVLLKQTKDTKRVAASLRRQFPAMQVQTWDQLSPMLQVLSGTMKQMTLIFVGIILVALAFGIINTMLMAVLDRTREIGMLLAVGMKSSLLFGMIMMETSFLSLTGAVIGVLAGTATVSWFGHEGIDLSVISEGFNALGYSSMVYPVIGAGFYLRLAGLVIIISLIAGLVPARRATRLTPAEALRGD